MPVLVMVLVVLVLTSWRSSQELVVDDGDEMLAMMMEAARANDNLVLEGLLVLPMLA